jgi:hypothetical protein
MYRILRTFPCLVISSLLVVCAQVRASVPTSDLAPGAIRGVKWTPANEGANGPAFDYAGLTATKFLDELALKGINSIILKVCDLDNQLPPGTTEADRYNAIRTVLQAIVANSHPFHVFLWKRQWYQDSGVNTAPSATTEFEREMANIINWAVRDGVDGVIEGIMPIEVNTTGSQQTLKFSVMSAHYINQLTVNASKYPNGFLHLKTFMWPGAGMGAFFKNIDTSWSAISFPAGITKQADFFAQMTGEVRRFSFIYKNMHSQDSARCSLGSYNLDNYDGQGSYGWDTIGCNLTFGSFNTQALADAERKRFLNDPAVMGYASLKSFLNGTAAASHPWMANVIYWGDANEGVATNCTSTSASKYMAAPAHTLLVTESSRLGSFIYYPCLPKGADDIVPIPFDNRKFLFIVKTVGGVDGMYARGTAGTGWQNWQGWPSGSYSVLIHTDAN